MMICKKIGVAGVVQDYQLIRINKKIKQDSHE